MSLPEDLSQFSALVAIIARLRAPDGCPWDRQQTHASLRGSLLSECYEALEALDEGDAEKLRGELGDLLLQVVLQARIAADNGEFEIGEVVEGINQKLIRRHPHVFGGQEVADAAEVAHNWEVIKGEERGEGVSILESVPGQLPALGYSQELQRRVAHVGFDWEDIGGVIDKLAEEVGEFQQADSQEAKTREFGDLLFTLANIALKMGIDAESALREANKRFCRRFSYMEAACRQQGRDLGEMPFDEQNALWEEAKRKQG